MCYMDTDLQMMKRSWMQCLCGFTHNHKHSLQMASESLWTEITCVENLVDYIEK
jgi:hypothetical protein